jgi:hypothetical protein
LYWWPTARAATLRLGECVAGAGEEGVSTRRERAENGGVGRYSVCACIRVFTRKNGEPTTAPNTPAVAPDAQHTHRGGGAKGGGEGAEGARTEDGAPHEGEKCLVVPTSDAVADPGTCGEVKETTDHARGHITHERRREEERRIEKRTRRGRRRI